MFHFSSEVFIFLRDVHEERYSFKIEYYTIATWLLAINLKNQIKMLTFYAMSLCDHVGLSD